MGWGDEPALVYSGTLGSWYRLEEMLDYYEAARTAIPGLRFLFLTPQVTLVEDAVRRRILTGHVVVRSVDSDSVPRYLAACDAGVCFLGKHPSKEASSPTKYGEYLASGLPVVTNGWVGDAYLFGGEPAWVLVGSFDATAYRRAALQMAKLLLVAEATRSAARTFAERELATAVAVERYDSLYRRVLERHENARSRMAKKSSEPSRSIGDVW
jgi:glycosyltransferase involved in cell wall biosynthesis